MTTYLPTLKQLQYLVALHDSGHFGRAAEACFVTQSTLSAGIRELETLIGVVLVERTRRVVRFTPLGERITDKARRVLREADELGDMARAAGRPLSGEMRMSVIPTIAPFMLPRILPRLRKDYPDLKLFLREETSGQACEALNHGRAAQLMVPVLQKCVEEVQDGELMSFSTYLRLSQKGKVLEIVTELDAELGSCMTKEARDVQLPAAPREDFWIQVNLAAML